MIATRLQHIRGVYADDESPDDHETCEARWLFRMFVNPEKDAKADVSDGDIARWVVEMGEQP